MKEQFVPKACQENMPKKHKLLKGGFTRRSNQRIKLLEHWNKNFIQFLATMQILSTYQISQMIKCKYR